jgi:hypothetical protein
MRGEENAEKKIFFLGRYAANNLIQSATELLLQHLYYSTYSAGGIITHLSVYEEMGYLCKTETKYTLSQIYL